MTVFLRLVFYSHLSFLHLYLYALLCLPFYLFLHYFVCLCLPVFLPLLSLCLRIFLPPYLTALLSHYLFAFLSFAILSLCHIIPSFLSTSFLLGIVFLLFLVKLAFTHIMHYIRLNYIDDIYPFLSRTASARFAANCTDSSGWISFLRRLSHRSSQNQMGRRQHGRRICRIHVLLCSSA